LRAAETPASEGRDEFSTYHLAKVPVDATNGLGSWIGTDKTYDRQTCRLWKEFDIPSGTKVISARIKMTVDDGYQFFLDGRELGQGANWRGLTEYDLTLLLTPGHHMLAVNCFNDLFLAGLIMNLSIELDNGKTLEIKSDETWRIVPENQKNWENLKHARAGWPAATVLADTERAPYFRGWPDDYMRVPRFQPRGHAADSPCSVLVVGNFPTSHRTNCRRWQASLPRPIAPAASGTAAANTYYLYVVQNGKGPW
jgi:hypothetical protein